ncbi:hypothetical protein [Burkholderia vietnamiensis]|uniref:hypothetical protein n=1 Tax=Burkholderia vietnamiensis TaxID=60552 RepID=UPI001CB0ED65|nr:hypothetical protein [Burkholderia vietnamiensis]CAG9229409.1 hypothetical protein BVI1335_70205 [Burkholderia vietnamiensis]HDR9086271.1 hypothetical protein [Burkholderia vietnamiensis]
MATTYMDRKRLAITCARWEQLRKEHDYALVREYENERISVTAEWCGSIKNGTTIPQQHWKPFRLSVVNIVSTDGEGRPLEKPLRTADPTASREFRSEQELVDAYEDILVRYAGCEWLPSSDGQGGRQFVERGNILVPPPPDAVDVRGMDEEVVDIAGSW